MKKILTALFFNLFIVAVSMAQNSQGQQDFKKTVAALNANNDSLAIEKLYLQTDKPNYLAGDTVWFKAYLFNATSLIPATKSGLLYIELNTDSNRLLRRIMVPVYNGISYGSIVLDEELVQGTYNIRGYTSWMLNFGENYQFKRDFYVGNGIDNNWLISYNAKVLKNSGRDKVQLGMRINEFDKSPIGLREVQVGILNGKKSLFKSKTETSQEGNLQLDFDLPEKGASNNISLRIEDLRKSQGNRKLLIPISINRPENIDLQFMPEGGTLVAELQSRVAFKALNEDGYGANISGKILNSKQEEVAEFSSTYKGMGTFSFIPQSKEVYTAKVGLPDGTLKTYPLPAVAESGTILIVNNLFKRDSCEVIVSATPDIAHAGKDYYLMGFSRNQVFWAARVGLNDGALRAHVNKNVFPGGIVKFILVDQDKQPLNERLIYNSYTDQLDVRLEANQPYYQQRDSVLLSIKVTDKNGEPVMGSFSMAVTDDGQVKQDSVATSTIISRVLLSSELKGVVEDPGYYFNAPMSRDMWNNMDQLLLTQGWVGYDWKGAFKPKKPMVYRAEKEFVVRGKVTNAFNKPVLGSRIALLSKKPLLILDTLTNSQGIFEFKGIVPVDTASFFLSAKNKRGKSFNVGIEMEEFKPPTFKGINRSITPWFVNIDTGSYTAMNQQLALQKKYLSATGKNMLKEVKITAKKVVRLSKNLNGAGEADLILDEEDMIKAGKATLLELLQTKVKGFREAISKTGQMYYAVNDLSLWVIIDGVNTKFFLSPGDSYYEYLKQVFEYYDAEQITGIEVMKSPKYQNRYSSRYIEPPAKPWETAFIEITTRGGNGPFLKKAIGTYLYRPLPFTISKRFYAPKYSSNSTADMTDVRSTVHWEPNILTDSNGNATVKFFTTDNIGHYTCIIEGADMQGSLGIQRKQITIRQQTVAKPGN